MSDSFQSKKIGLLCATIVKVILGESLTLQQSIMVVDVCIKNQEENIRNPITSNLSSVYKSTKNLS